MGKAIRTKKDWEITSFGRERLVECGFNYKQTRQIEQVLALETYLKSINDLNPRKFLSLVIRCFEHELFRAAIVMIWAAAIYQLKAVVANNYLDKFNAEASRVNRVWRPAETSDDLGLMKEADS